MRGDDRVSRTHWRALDKGLHLGTARGRRAVRGLCGRFGGARKYQKAKLGLADDFRNADGKTLDYSQALNAARAWGDKAVRIEAGIEDAHKGTYTVGDVMMITLEHHKEVGKSYDVMKTITNAHILPTFEKLDVMRLTPSGS